MPLGKRRHSRSLLLATAGTTALVSLLYLAAGFLHATIGLPFRNLELRVQDGVTKVAALRRPGPVDPRLVFLADDAPSHTLDHLWEDEIAASPALKLMQRHDWTREVPALILERLAGAGAKVVAFDYMYQGENDGDDAFRAAIEKWREVVVLGCQFEERRMGGGFNQPPKTLIPASGELDQALGFVNFWRDEDNVVRRARFQTTTEEVSRLQPPPDTRVFSSLAARMIRKAGLGELVPADHGQHLFRYVFKGEMLETSQLPPSVSSIFVPAIWEANYQNGAFFRDKIVLIGPEGRYNKDLALSPFGIVAGPELHLNAANALLQQQFLRESPLWVDFLLIAAGGLLAWCAGRFVEKPLWRIPLIALAAGSWFAAAVALDAVDWVVPVFSPLLTLLGASLSFSFAEQILERVEKARLRKTFERYVSRDVVQELVDHPEGWLNTLGGARKNITVLFSDLRGFTTLTESAKDPHALVLQLNEYFDEMVRIVFARRGTLDKFIGDAVMAHWGGIQTSGEAEDARHAVAAALEMRTSLVPLNAGWKARGMLELSMGLGVNHGEAIVGNLGAEAKKEVTAIGDTVNLASRLEGVTKTYHVDFCIGESVARLVRSHFVLRSLDLIIVKGKTRAVEIFAVLGERTTGTPEPPWLAAHEEAMRLYRTGDFAEAERRWQEVRAQQPADGVSEVFLERCATLQREPTASGWTGVFAMTGK